MGSPAGTGGVLRVDGERAYYVRPVIGYIHRGYEKLAEFRYGPEQGIMEEIISPWNASRVALALTGQSEAAMSRLAKLFSSDELFGMIEEGNIAVVNDDSTKSLVVMKQGDARFMYPQDLRQGFNLPNWAWIIVGAFAVIGLFSVARFLFGR